jgi:hypothetical protein
MNKNKGSNNNAMNEVNTDDAALNVAADVTPAFAASAATAPCRPADHTGTFVVLKWSNSFMCLRGALLDKIAHLGSNRQMVAAASAWIVIWNDHRGICRLVSFPTALRICSRSVPEVAFLSYNNSATMLWDIMTKIAPNHIEALKKYSDRIVGAFDSFSSASARLEHALVLMCRLSVPTDMFQRALEDIVRIRQRIVNEGVTYMQICAQQQQPHTDDDDDDDAAAAHAFGDALRSELGDTVLEGIHWNGSKDINLNLKRLLQALGFSRSGVATPAAEEKEEEDEEEEKEEKEESAAATAAFGGAQ